MAEAFVEIASERLRAAINPFGAELSSLREHDGGELMTDADPAFWSGRAPLLFPIVGRLVDDCYRLDGKDYPLPQHGFARRQGFDLVEQAADRAVFRLTDNEATRAVYPFAFALDAAFTLTGMTLAIDVTVTNCGDRDMPASFGFHPAFAWPLPFGGGKADHRIVFACEEPGPITALTAQGWLGGQGPSPVEGRTLALRDTLFAEGALIWQGLASRSLRYESEAGRGLAIDFDADTLGVWTKPGAAFVCIEPWHGIADPPGFSGEIWDKPGMLRFAPGEARTFGMRVTVTG